VLAQRALLPQKKVKVEAQVEQRSIRPDVFSTLNLDRSLGLPMRHAQWETLEPALFMNTSAAIADPLLLRVKRRLVPLIDSLSEELTIYSLGH
jgi:hypothetical protein